MLDLYDVVDSLDEKEDFGDAVKGITTVNFQNRRLYGKKLAKDFYHKENFHRNIDAYNDRKEEKEAKEEKKEVAHGDIEDKLEIWLNPNTTTRIGRFMKSFKGLENGYDKEFQREHMETFWGELLHSNINNLMRNGSKAYGDLIKPTSTGYRLHDYIQEMCEKINAKNNW